MGLQSVACLTNVLKAPGKEWRWNLFPKRELPPGESERRRGRCVETRNSFIPYAHSLQLSWMLYVIVYAIRYLWPEMLSRNVSHYIAINNSSSLPQLILSHSKMVLLSSTLIERASAFVHNFTVIAAIGVITISLLLYDTYRVVSDPLRKVPGPFWARYTRLWEVYHVRKGHFHSLNVELHEKYGKLHRCSHRSS